MTYSFNCELKPATVYKYVRKFMVNDYIAVILSNKYQTATINSATTPINLK